MYIARYCMNQISSRVVDWLLFFFPLLQKITVNKMSALLERVHLMKASISAILVDIGSRCQLDTNFWPEDKNENVIMKSLAAQDFVRSWQIKFQIPLQALGSWVPLTLFPQFNLLAGLMGGQIESKGLLSFFEKKAGI